MVYSIDSDTLVRDSSASEVVGLGTFIGITSQHPEIFRECGEVVVVGTSSCSRIVSYIRFPIELP